MASKRKAEPHLPGTMSAAVRFTRSMSYPEARSGVLVPRTSSRGQYATIPLVRLGAGKVPTLSTAGSLVVVPWGLVATTV